MSFKSSIKTSDQTEAKGVAARVEETIRLLERGRLELPAGADAGIFILSDGKASAEQRYTLGDLLKLYQKILPQGAKAETPLNTEEIHISHLLRHFKKTKFAQSITAADMQACVHKRLPNMFASPHPRSKSINTFPESRESFGELALRLQCAAFSLGFSNGRRNCSGRSRITRRSHASG
jgi:hypothetical protein